MTKRMLSLLLALVMTLSLCVPALAADEFEAETVTEVEEQAPVAPVEPEAPEAEEPVDEAVATVAAPVEEEPADEPESAFLDGSNLPAVGFLRGAVDGVEAIRADLEAGKYMSWGIKDVKDAPSYCMDNNLYYYSLQAYVNEKPDLGVRLVLNKLADAKALLNDAEYYHKTDAEIRADAQWLVDAYNALKTTVPNTTNTWTNGFAQMKGYFAKNAFNAEWFYGEAGKGTAWYVHEDVSTDAAADWYQPAYLTRAKALVKAIAAVQDPDDKNHLNFVAAKAVVDEFKALVNPFHENGALSNAANWGAAYKPTGDDVQDLYDMYVAAEKALAGKSKLSIDESEIKTHIDWAEKSYFELSTGSGAKSNVLRKNVMDMIDLLDTDMDELYENGHAVTISRYAMDSKYENLTLYFGLSQLTVACTGNTDGSPVHKGTSVTTHFAWQHDDHTYTLKYSINGASEQIASHGGSANKLFQNLTPQQMYEWGSGTNHDFVVKISAAGPENAKFSENTVIVLNLYDNTGALVQNVTVNVGDKTYSGPVIVASGYIIGKDAFNKEAAKWGKRDAMSEAGDDNFYVFLSNGASTTYTPITLEIKSPSGKKLTKTMTNNEANSRSAWVGSITNAYLDTLEVEVGDYSVTMNVTTAATGKIDVRGTATINVPSINKYAGFADMQAAMTATAGYESKVAKAGENTADLHQVIANALKAGNKLVADAAKTPNVKFYRDQVTNVKTTLNDTMKKLVAPGSLEALQAAITTAKNLKGSDFSNWNTYRDLIADAVKAGEKVVASKPGNDEASVKKITDATRDITNLMDKLIVKPASKTALKALVDSVPTRLAADDYTEASKNAVQTAAAEAEALLTKQGALQSEIDAAATKLEAALAALKVEPEDPDAVKAPASGNGWVHHTDGNYYYFEDGVMMKDFWMTSGRGSAHGLWYYLKADGTLATGFQYVSNPAGSGWYYFQPTNKNGCIGAVLAGWQYINSDIGWGWFQTKHNGHYGECTYTTKWGDYTPGYVPMNP